MSLPKLRGEASHERDAGPWPTSLARWSSVCRRGERGMALSGGRKRGSRRRGRLRQRGSRHRFGRCCRRCFGSRHRESRCRRGSRCWDASRDETRLGARRLSGSRLGNCRPTAARHLRAQTPPPSGPRRGEPPTGLAACAMEPAWPRGNANREIGRVKCCRSTTTHPGQRPWRTNPASGDQHAKPEYDRQPTQAGAQVKPGTQNQPNSGPKPQRP